MSSPASFLTVSDLRINRPPSGGRPAEDAPIIAHLSFTLAQGEFLQINGASGIGKSTLLNALAGLLPTAAGSITIGGCAANDKHLATAYVQQGYGLLPWKTVGANIALPGLLGGRMRSEAAQRHIIETLQLTDLCTRYPQTLSGGQRQRAALARAFCQEAQLLLLDEPFSALDADKAAEAFELLLALREQYPVTTVMVTHHALPRRLATHKRLTLLPDFQYTLEDV